MIKIPIEKIKERIKEKTGLSEKEINTKIKDKLDLLSGLISEEGAAHIIANELGVKIFEEQGKLQVKNVLGGMRNVELTGKIIKVYEIKEFDKNNRKGKIGSFLIGDETGLIRVVAWNDKADLLNKLKEQDIIKIENGYSRDNNGRVEVHLGDKSNVTISPKETTEIKVKESSRERKKIKDLKETDDNVELLGTVVQTFDPKFFETCPDCGKRAKEKEDGFYCEQHNKVQPVYSYVLNLILDDGTDNIRVVLWKNQVQKLFNMTDQEIVEKKDTSFEEIKTELLGKIIKIMGRVNKNTMFERLEFIAQFIFPNPNPEEELERLKKELENAKEEPEEKKDFLYEGTPETPEEGEEDNEEVVEEIDLGKTEKKEVNNKKGDEDILEEIDDLEDLDSI